MNKGEFLKAMADKASCSLKEAGVAYDAFVEAYKDKDGNRKELTEWHNVVCWRNLADIAEKFLRKGRLLYVEGRLRTRTWEDANGAKHYFTDVEASGFTMLGGKDDDKPTEKQVEQAEPVSFVDNGSDLPF